MPERVLITNELAKLLGVLAHPHRIRIVEELRNTELDVNSLQAALGISHSRVSQNLALLRSYRLVVERREGRHVFYRLSQPRLAQWLLDGLEFLEGEAVITQGLRDALGKVRMQWGDESASGNGVDENAGKRSDPE